MNGLVEDRSTSSLCARLRWQDPLSAVIPSLLTWQGREERSVLSFQGNGRLGWYVSRVFGCYLLSEDMII